MAETVLFIGWGAAVRGREQQALQVFNEALQFYARQQQAGAIRSFEPIALEPHGGDLAGFLVIRGERAQIERLRATKGFMRLNNRALLVVERFGIVNGFLGEELQRLYADYGAQAAELAGAAASHDGYPAYQVPGSPPSR